MQKDVNKLELENVFRVLSALWKMKEPTTFPSVAKDLGVNRVDFFYWVTEKNKYHFKVETCSDHKPHITAYWPDAINNPENPEWLPMMKDKHAKTLYFTKIDDYGWTRGWELKLDGKGSWGFGWRNTEEKLAAVRESKLVKDHVFSLGGWMDGRRETHFGFEPIDKEATANALEAAGWKVCFEK